jgi:hypothetical protein
MLKDKLATKNPLRKTRENDVNENLTQEEIIDRSIYGSTRQLDYLLKQAVIGIDAQFGDGFAKANPSLVAAYLQAGVTMSYSLGEGIIEAAANKIAESIEDLATAISDAFDTEE